MTTVTEPNPSLRQIMGQTWSLLQKHPGLWNPPLVLNLLLALLAANGGKGMAVLVPMTGAWLLTIAFRAGWFEQMSRVVKAGDTPAPPAADGPPRVATWASFLEGVGRNFWRFLAGELAQLVLLGLGLAIAAWVAVQAVGWPDPEMLKQVMATAKQSGDALQKLPKDTVAQLNAWTLALLSWAGYWGVLAMALLFWQTLCVWRNQTWPTAWALSLRTVVRHLGLVVPFVVMQTLAYLFVFQLLVSGPGLLMMLGYAGYLLVWTFFSLALFLVLQRWEPHVAPAAENP